MADESVAAVMDAPVSAPATESTPESTVELTPSPEGTQQTAKPEAERLDKRANPDALRKTLKWLEENGGEHSAQANELRKHLGENKSYKTVYPTVREAREAKMAIDAVGGVAKIAELQQAASRGNEFDQMWSSADPRAVEEAFKDPEMAKGIAKLTPQILSKIQQSDPQAYSAALKPHAFQMLSSEGFPAVMAAMIKASKDGDTATMQRHLNDVAQWWDSNIQGLDKPDTKSPEQQAWEKERDQSREEIYKGKFENTFKQVMSHATGALDKHLMPEKKRLGLSDEAYNLLRQDAWKYVVEARDKDPIFKATAGTKVNAQGKKISDDATQFFSSYTDRFAKEAAERAIRVRYGHLKGAAAAPVAKPSPTAPPSGTAQPDHMRMRAKFGREGAMDQILAGKALDKNGKPLVQAGKGVWKYA